MFRYRLHFEDGSDAGEATYAQMIHLGDEIHVGGGKRFRGWRRRFPPTARCSPRPCLPVFVRANCSACSGRTWTSTRG
jgi:hypothetical protein